MLDNVLNAPFKKYATQERGVNFTKKEIKMT